MIWRLLAPVMLLAALCAGARADEGSARPGSTVELRLTLSRNLGGDEIAHSTHTLRMIAEKGPAQLSTGLEMPVWTRAGDTPTTVFKDVGIHVSCAARLVGDGLYELPCELGQDSPFPWRSTGHSSPRPSGGFPLGDRPEILMFGTRATLLLRDGQTARWVEATDPVTGQTIEVKVELNVLNDPRIPSGAAPDSTPIELDVRIDRHGGAAPAGHARYTLRPVLARETIEVKAGVLSPIRNPDGMTTFRDSGVFIGCKPEVLENSRYRLSCSFSQRSPHPGPEDWAAMGAAVESFSLGTAHVLRQFRASTVLEMRDAETVLWPAGTDPVTGETVEIRVTVTSVEGGAEGR